MKKFILLAVVLLGTVSNATAAPILWVDNGHYYDLVIPTLSNDWFSDQTAANSSTYLDLSGHLVTITSADENDFLATNFATGGSSPFGAWIGGKAPEGWLDGPENGQLFGYTNWGGIEPNNAGYAYMNLGAAFAGISTGKWADDDCVQGFPNGGCYDPVIGYLVEYEGGPVVPEPATMFLFATGLAGAFLRKRL